MEKQSAFNIHPMDQFIIDPILTGESLEWYSFTNQALWMLISLVAISFVFIYGSRKHQLVPGRLQSIAELLYFFIRDMISLMKKYSSPAIDCSRPGTN